MKIRGPEGEHYEEVQEQGSTYVNKEVNNMIPGHVKAVKPVVEREAQISDVSSFEGPVPETVIKVSGR